MDPLPFCRVPELLIIETASTVPQLGFYLSTNLFFHSVFLVGLLILFTFEMRITKEHISRAGQAGGRSFKKEKEL